MEIKCQFKITLCHSEELYTCNVEEASIRKKENVIKELKGVQLPERSHKDVKCVRFNQTNVKHFPRGLEKHFPNLTHLYIGRCGIKEIFKSDLKGLEGLVHVTIEKCELTSLPDNLFSEMPNLRTVSFAGNKIEFASSELLKPLIGRENVKVNLQRNKSIDAFYWPGILLSLESLEDLMKLIDEKCIEPIVVPDPANSNQKLKEMWISGKHSDLTIIAGDKKFNVHKAVLGVESKVFDQIFEDQSEATEIKIPDFSANSVEALLKFIYTNEVTEDEDVKEIFVKEIIFDQVNETNAWKTFLFSHRFASQCLKVKAFKVIAEKIPEDLPDELMDDPENLKKLIVARKVYEEILSESKKLSLNKNK